MFGPGGASGPYTLVMPERCIPCERILCERYTSGAALLLSLANNMNVDMGDIRSHHFRNVVYHVWARWCIRPIHASYAGAVHFMWKNSLWTVHEWRSTAALVSKLNMIYECRYGRHSEPPFLKRCLACIGHLAHIHSSHAGAALSVVELQRS